VIDENAFLEDLEAAEALAARSVADALRDARQGPDWAGSRSAN
jgi:hypothetical protein